MELSKAVAGTALVDILYQLFEIITYNKVTPRENDALNRECCMWARANQRRFPVDRRALKRRVIEPEAEVGIERDFDVIEVRP